MYGKITHIKYLPVKIFQFLIITSETLCMRFSKNGITTTGPTTDFLSKLTKLESVLLILFLYFIYLLIGSEKLRSNKCFLHELLKSVIN